LFFYHRILKKRVKESQIYSGASIKLSEYLYELSEDKIAKFPLDQRDHSKLLVYQKGKIEHKRFFDLPNYFDKDDQFFFNDTKVIPARLIFTKDTGAIIEIFLLNPITPTEQVGPAMLVEGSCVWHVMVGNLKKWKNNHPLKAEIPYGERTLLLTAEMVDLDKKWVRFSWDPSEVSFVDVVKNTGEVPLPPYMNRKAQDFDKPRYQTVYSKNEGAVAAPTAGLHFTPEVLKNLADKEVKEDFLTLHVSAGTFQPIKTENIKEHTMHSEQVILNRANIKNIIHSDRITAVGTTSMRTLESAYWYGHMLLQDPIATFEIPKLYPYDLIEKGDLPSKKDAFQAILDHMNKKGVENITGTTEIFIFPGYEFQVVDRLITNFHQPGSTLILLIAAFVGNNWRAIYNEALNNEYRFLSYGDSSLLIRSN
jgi:S-adenosylmethionine:tRNA ribosyltransferase-isomerase